MQTISFDISGNANIKPSVTASSKNGATVTVGESKVSTSEESTYVDDDGNYCFHTNILLPALTQDFTALEVTPYLHLEDGTETDLDFASFRVDYK